MSAADDQERLADESPSCQLSSSKTSLPAPVVPSGRAKGKPFDGAKTNRVARLIVWELSSATAAFETRLLASQLPSRPATRAVWRSSGKVTKAPSSAYFGSLSATQSSGQAAPTGLSLQTKLPVSSARHREQFFFPSSAASIRYRGHMTDTCQNCDLAPVLVRWRLTPATTSPAESPEYSQPSRGGSARACAISRRYPGSGWALSRYSESQCHASGLSTAWSRSLPVRCRTHRFSSSRDLMTVA